MQEEKKYGFIPPVIESNHYVLGGASSLPKIILRPDANWEPYLPLYEPQFNANYDTDGCSVWGTENALETLFKHLTGNDANYSERYIYILGKVQPPGADVHHIAEVIRAQGMINDILLPFTASFQEFLQPDPMKVDYLVTGQQWLTKYQFGHEWVYTGITDQAIRLKLLKEALQYSPIGISVTAWYQNVDGRYYSPAGIPNCHWCVCYKIDEEGIHVFDSYDQSKKILTLDHDISFAKRYLLQYQTKKNSWLYEMFRQILIGFGVLQKESLAVQQPNLPAPVVPQVEPKPVIVSKISLDAFCIAIRDYEGKPGDLNYRNNNPGNCRCSKIGYRPIYGNVRCVNNFAVFPTYGQGMLYLNNIVKQKAVEHPNWTIYDYFALFHAPSVDHNDPKEYADAVAKHLGIPVTTTIGQLA